MNLGEWEVGDTLLRDGQHRRGKGLIGKDEEFSLGCAELGVRGRIPVEESRRQRSWGWGE